MNDENIVFTNVAYNSSILSNNIYMLQQVYKFLSVEIAGNSVLGKPIYVIRLGVGTKEVFYSASIHANEWITSVLLMKFVENYCKAFIKGDMLYGYPLNDLFYNCSIYIMPMVNPDGVDLINGNISNSNYIKAENIALNYPNIAFPNGWKSNINGVDLNLQFPAGWLEAKNIKYSQGYTSPAPRDFVGFGPLTEPESLAIYNFTLSHNFRLVIAYHTQGKEIYWNFQNINPLDGFEVGIKFVSASGYSLEDVPYNSSFAGYKDWFIQDYNRPGYTIEAGSGENPLPISQFDEIYNDNIGILVLGAII